MTWFLWLVLRKGNGVDAHFNGRGLDLWKAGSKLLSFAFSLYLMIIEHFSRLLHTLWTLLYSTTGVTVVLLDSSGPTPCIDKVKSST